ncbi:hypothetical protein BC938DRAFT_482129 [Jimgerdemannia flammicorona]|uniref:Uncharacterized protein n=1 Tax=Jimgerdemannia flammicorona TaxID=994334 RepID=A0A433QER7_9FUNG|nr:hypothetical protein BC938DRAFT_482129 [Jimgerdemannia flammicorona]
MSTMRKGKVTSSSKKSLKQKTTGRKKMTGQGMNCSLTQFSKTFSALGTPQLVQHTKDFVNLQEII